MNICMFTNTYRPHIGGVAGSVSRFEEDLKKLGHRVLIVAPTYAESTEKEPEGSEVLRVPAIQNFNGSDFSVRIPIPFITDEKIDAFAPDIIHSHHPFLLGDAAIRAAYRRQMPIVYTNHTLYEEYTHYVSSRSPKMKKFVVRMTTAYANMCTHVVAPSKSIGELLKKRGVKTPVTEVPTGVDCEAFENADGIRFRKSVGIPENARVIGHLGRLAPEKNLVYLAQAVGQFLEKDPEAWFLVVGEGPDKSSIEKILADKGLEKRLVMAGKKTGQSLIDAYYAMDLFVFSSKTETQGMVLAEAMAAATPVIALDATGVREVVSDMKNGRLLKGDSSQEEFAAAIKQFFEDTGNMESMKKSALATARGFDRINCASRLSELYEEICKTWTKEKRSASIDDLLGDWDEILKAVRMEWNILSRKIDALTRTLTSSD
ncbi:MAG: glycosyltransferase [Desulfobacterales bacterium]